MSGSMESYYYAHPEANKNYLEHQVMDLRNDIQRLTTKTIIEKAEYLCSCLIISHYKNYPFVKRRLFTREYYWDIKRMLKNPDWVNEEYNKRTKGEISIMKADLKRLEAILIEDYS